MGAHSRRKGAAGEREAAELVSRLWPGAKRGLAQSRTAKAEGADVDAPGCPYWIEVKRGARINVTAAYEQAKRDSDGRQPLALTRSDRGEWLVTMSWEVFERILKQCGKTGAVHLSHVEVMP